MRIPNSTKPTRLLLSFSSVYKALARRIANDLGAANIDVRYDQWDGGGGLPARRALANDMGDVAFVLPLLTPSAALSSWIGKEWKTEIYEEACANNIDVLPVLGEGDRSAVPDFLEERSFADLRGPGYSLELRRLLKTMRDLSGDTSITLPADSETAAMPSLQAPTAATIAIEVGQGLASMFANDQGKSRFLNEMMPMMRDGLFYELGVRFPAPDLRANADLRPWSVRIVINGVPEVEEIIRPDSVLVNATVDAMTGLGIDAEPGINPANGAQSAWIPQKQAARLAQRGFMTWNATEFLVLLLSSELRRMAADFIGTSETRVLLRMVEKAFPQLLAETVPKAVSLFVLADVLRRLVAEGVSIRNLRLILMALADWGRTEDDPLYLTEYVRAALKRQLTHNLSRGTNTLVIFLLDPAIEDSIRNAIRYTATGSYVDLDPERLSAILKAIKEPMATLEGAGIQVPQILTVTEIRSSVRRIVETSFPELHVVSYQDLTPTANIQPVGRITFDGFVPRAAVSVDGVPLWS